jgi:hypothetical protein
MLVTYVVPLAALAATYARVGVELWGSKAIGERTAGQEESARSKRKVRRKNAKQLKTVYFLRWPIWVCVAFEVIIGSNLACQSQNGNGIAFEI